MSFNAAGLQVSSNVGLNLQLWLYWADSLTLWPSILILIKIFRVKFCLTHVPPFCSFSLFSVNITFACPLRSPFFSPTLLAHTHFFPFYSFFALKSNLPLEAFTSVFPPPSSSSSSSSVPNLFPLPLSQIFCFLYIHNCSLHRKTHVYRMPLSAPLLCIFTSFLESVTRVL